MELLIQILFNQQEQNNFRKRLQCLIKDIKSF